MPTGQHVLLTFLGKGMKSRSRPGYEQTTYDFGQGRTEHSRIFGMALLRHLAKNADGPVQRVVLVGTSGSDWDMLYDELGLLADDAAEVNQTLEHAATLSSATAADAVSDWDIAPLAERIGNVLRLECRCVVIPYGSDSAGQVEILRHLTKHVAPHDRVTLDLTHGLRHLPIIGLVSALYVKTAREAEVAAVYYGALDMRSQNEQGFAPVLRLDGLLDIAAWIGSLQTFDKDADYGVFAPLLRKEGVAHEALVALRRAAFLERTARIGEARTALAEFRARAGNLSESSGVASLFAVSLGERLSWADAPGHYARQRELAFLHLDHQDYLRATLFGLEAFKTLIAHRSGRPINQQSSREEAVDEFVATVDRVRELSPGERTSDQNELAQQGRAFHALRSYRNAIVHIDNPKGGDVVDAMKSPEKTHEAIGAWLEEVLPPHDPEFCKPGPATALQNTGDLAEMLKPTVRR